MYIVCYDYWGYDIATDCKSDNLHQQCFSPFVWDDMTLQQGENLKKYEQVHPLVPHVLFRSM